MISDKEDRGSITAKIITFFIFAIIEIVANTLTFYNDLNNNKTVEYKSDVNINNVITFVLLGLQVIMHFCLIFWFFFLVWKTFLFKFGLLGRLMKKEFPILLLMPINFVFFLVESFLRIYYQLINNPKSNVITIYQEPMYIVFFAIRHISTIYVFAAGLKAAIQVGHPSYYKPQKWLM